MFLLGHTCSTFLDLQAVNLSSSCQGWKIASSIKQDVERTMCLFGDMHKPSRSVSSSYDVLADLPG